MLRVALAAGLLMVSSTAAAIPVTYTFVGTINRVEDPNGEFGGSLIVGVSEITGSFTIDDTTFSSSTIVPNVGGGFTGSYNFDGSPHGFSAEVAGITFQNDPAPNSLADAQVLIRDDVNIGGIRQDGWSVQSREILEPVGFTGPLFLNMGLVFNRLDAYADPSYDLPPSLDQALEFGGSGFARLARIGGGLDVSAELTFFSAPSNPNVLLPPIPEPGTSGMLALGLAGLALGRRVRARF